MQKQFLLWGLILSWFGMTSLQAQSIMSDPYSQAWKTIDSLEQQGLYRSALEATETLLVQLRENKLSDQVIRGIVYRARYSREVNEDGESLALKQLEEELSQATAAEKAVLTSILAAAYSQYLDLNRWQINNRTPLAGGAEGGISNWTTKDFVEKINSLYLNSVAEEGLKSINIQSWAGIIDPGENTVGLRPTLYDLLAFRAIDYFASGNATITEPIYRFQLDQTAAFADLNDFIRFDFTSRDQNSTVYQALKLYQSLLAFRAERPGEREALVDADLLRLQFVRNQSTLQDRDERYKNALERLRQGFDGQPVEAKIILALADFYYQRGSSYSGRDKSKALDWQLAHDLYQEVEYSYYSSPQGQIAAAKRAGLRVKELQLMVEQVYLPNQAGLFKIGYRNVEKVYWRMVKLGQPEMESEHRKEELIRMVQSRQVLRSGEQSLELPRDYRLHGTELFFEAMPIGFYAIMISDQADFAAGAVTAVRAFSISRLGPLVLPPQGGRPTSIIVADRETGVPLPGVEVLAYDTRNSNQRNIVGRTRTDGSGRAVFDELNQRAYAQLFFRFGEDQLFSRDYVYGYRYRDSRRPRQATEFFLDRGIYRPGQTLYFKALVLEYSKDNLPKLLANEEVTISLRDVNGQEISQLSLRSNEFGSVQGTFTLPTGRLTGRMSLISSIGGTYQGVQVEEYKRPRFLVEMDELDGRPKLGEEVTVTGSALNYAGPALQGAIVRYNINRQLQLPWWYRSYYPDNSQKTVIATGETTTDEQGQFSINFTSLAPTIDQNRPWWSPLYEYVISVDVTDVTGETHSAEKSIRLTKSGIELSIDSPQEADRQDGLKLGFSAKNADGATVDLVGSLEVHRLDHPNQVFVNRYWDKPDYPSISESEFRRRFPNFAYGEEDQTTNWPVLGLQYQGNMEANAAAIDLDIRNWPIGVYDIRISTPAGEKLNQYLTIFDTGAKLAPVGKVLWLKENTIKIEPGSQAEIPLGTAAGTMIADIDFSNRNGLKDHNWVNASPLAVYKLDVTEEDRGGIVGKINALRYNRRFQERIQIEVPWSNKELSIRYETFRDKLRPGEKEEWRLVIEGPSSTRVGAELLATMYDASLDQLFDYDWRFSPFPDLRSSAGWQANSFQFSTDYGYGAQGAYSYPRIRYPSFQHINLDWQRFMARSRQLSELDVVYSAPPPPAPPAQGKVAAAPQAFAADASAEANVGSLAESSPSKPAAEEQKPVAIRKNLQETAFFFPELRTDAEGRIILSFDSPESLTKWNFRLLAHTPDLAFALDSREVVTQKELMILPNAPRFLREGDDIYFTAKVSNLSEGTLVGAARLELLDASTMQPINEQFSLAENRIPFTLDPDASKGLDWQIKVPQGGAGAIVYRVIAEAGNFSDGEENVLPILTNRTMVTAAIPLHVGAKESKNFQLEPLVNLPAGATPQQVKLQITSNPAWLAVKSLPYLMEYPYNCTEQIVNRFYANSLATNVVERYPQMRAVFDQWKASGSALVSPLDKNQELAGILLEETPWLKESMDETQQRERIALLFDLDRMADEQMAALEELINRQEGDGGFSWFPGGKTNWYMTQYVLENLLRLIDLGVWTNGQPDAEVTKLMQNAIRFVDAKALEHYERIKERVEKGLSKWEDDHLSSIIIHYLYVKSLVVSDKPTGQMAEANLFFLDQADKFWLQKGLFGQAMLALALDRSGRAATSKAIFRSLQERALQSEELGMYWKYPRGFFWNELPIETHVMLMETFKELGGTPEELNALKVWLLKNKETNRWETTKATSAAVYGLLSTGEDWLGESELVQVNFPKAQKNSYEARLTSAQASAEAGTGFYETQWNNEEVQPTLGQVRLRNKNKTIAWGGLYFQYFQDIDKIEGFSDSPLKVNRQLYRRDFGDAGESLTEVSTGQELVPGQRLTVRLNIETDRDMEYVHLKDLRASGMEPTEVLSGYRYQDGLGYYQSITDVGVHFFFDYLPKGKYVLEYDLFVIHRGDFSSGMASLQCMYAPAFSAYSAGRRLKID